MYWNLHFLLMYVLNFRKWYCLYHTLTVASVYIHIIIIKRIEDVEVGDVAKFDDVDAYDCSTIEKLDTYKNTFDTLIKIVKFNILWHELSKSNLHVETPQEWSQLVISKGQQARVHNVFLEQQEPAPNTCVLVNLSKFKRLKN